MPFYPDELYKILRDRLETGDAGSSYTKRLAEDGPPKLIRKLVEEAGEVAGAYIEEGGDQHLVEEIADLWYHCLVMMAVKGIDPQRVHDLLAERHRTKSDPA